MLAARRFYKITECQQEWDALASPSIHLTSEWLRWAEGMHDGASQYAVLAEEGGALASGLVAYRLASPARGASLDPTQLVLGRAVAQGDLRPFGEPEGAEINRLIEELADHIGHTYPSVSCVAPYGFVAGVKGRAAGLGLAYHLAAEFESLATDWGAKTRAILYLEEGSTLSDEFVRRGYNATTLGARCVLPLVWETFEEYIATSARPRRVRREARALTDGRLDTEIGRAPQLLQHIDRLTVLLGRLADRAGSSDMNELRGFLLGIHEHMAEHLRLVLLRHEGVIVAFSLLYEWNNAMYVHVSAHDYSAIGREMFAHFNALYYVPIMLGLKNGHDFVDYGLDGYRAKVLRGCKLLTVQGCFKFEPRLPAVDRLLALEDLVRRRILWTLAGHGPTGPSQ